MLARKIVVWTMLGFALLAGVDYALVYLLGMPHYRSLEERDARESLQRCQETFDRELEHLTTFCADWSYWDDTYQFIRERNQRYITSNLSVNTFRDSHIDLIYILDHQGRVAWGQAYDPETQTPLTLSELPLDSLVTDHPLIVRERSPVAGLMDTSKYPMLVVSLPILTTAKEGPVAGSMIMGRFLTPSLLGTLQRQTNVEFHLIHKSSMSGRTKPQKNSSGAMSVIPRNDDSLEVYSGYRSIYSDDPFELLAVLPRSILHEGLRTIFAVWLSLLAVGGVILMLLFLLMRSIVLKPLSRLQRHVTEIKRRDTLDQPIFSERADEIGVLAREFDGTIGQLLDTRSRLLEASYRSGLAEMAGHLLHDLRNSLAPVSIQLQRIQDNLSQISFEKLESARLEIEKPDIEESRRRDISQYMRLYYDKIGSLTGAAATDIDSLQRINRNIEEILADQDVFERMGPVIESIHAGQILSQALDRLPDAIRARVTVENQVPDTQILNIARLPVVEILVSLFAFIGRKSQHDIHTRVSADGAILTIWIALPESLVGQIGFERGRHPELHRVANTLHVVEGVFELIGASLAIRIPIRTSARSTCPDTEC
jgi:two-component system, NtrC family, sensor kinase